MPRGALDGVCVGSIGPAARSSDVDPNPRSAVINFGEDVHRGYKQYAAFTSIDFDIIPKVLTLTGGTRYYHYNEYELGTQYLGNCTNVPIWPIYGGGNIIDAEHDATYHGFKSRGNLTWHITPDAMVYYTFSQGFRPGGFNRFSQPALRPGADVRQRRRHPPPALRRPPAPALLPRPALTSSRTRSATRRTR